MVAVREIPSVDERALVDRARRGDRAAFAAVYAEHAPAAWRLALAVSRESTAARGALVSAFTRVLTSPERDGFHTHAAFRPYLLAAVRDAAIDHHRILQRTDLDQPVPDDLTVSRPADEVEAQAFAAVPERWRSVLWLTDVEGLPPAEVGRVLGMTATGVPLLADRARAGLRQRFAQLQLRGATERDCEWASERLEGYVGDDLSERETTHVRRHLDACADCCDRLTALEDLAPRLPRWVLALPASLAVTAEGAWLAALPVSTGRLGLVLPGGHPVPAWAERTLAGAAAAVVALGITGALLTGGRPKDAGPLAQAQAPADEPLDLTDGESAARGTTPELPTDDGGPATADPTSPGADPSTPGDPATASPTGSAPRGPAGTGPTVPIGPPATPSDPTDPVGPTDPTDPVDPTDPPSPPTTAPGPGGVTVTIDDETGVEVGDCIGAEVLGIVIGCEPSGPTGISLGGTSLLP